ncbi:MAG: hypothetical protein N3B16_07665 [Candidatus Aminicenantes bacterium]|nr:hypothetical protein [Candidatus Aminicenantes bacterium]
MAQRWLKVDLHIHTKEDPKDNITYDAYQLIVKAASLGFQAIAITNHNQITISPELKDFAENHQVHLLPGAEISCEGRHVIIINPPFNLAGQKFTWSDLKELKQNDSLIIAPHPYFPGFRSLFERLDYYHYLFDAIEFSAFYNRFFNPNKKAIEASLKYGKPLIACSDTHNLWQLGTSFTLVEAELSTQSIIQAIKKNRLKLACQPLPLVTMARIMINFLLADKLHLPLHI